MQTNLTSGRKLDGRTRLLNAAATLFAQGGFDDVSVSKILEMSDLKAPSLYHHFGDKEGLYAAWAIAVLDAAGTRIEEEKPQSLATMAELILDGAQFDYLQIQRDLRSLKHVENQTNVQAALERNLFDPAKALIEKIGNSTEPAESAYLYLHLVMYAHPVYASQRKATGAKSNLTEWLADQIVATNV